MFKPWCEWGIRQNILVDHVLNSSSAVSLAEAKFKCHNKVDMGILLDSSASVSKQQFQIAKTFAADLVKHFDISKDKTNVAVASFSQYAHSARTFKDNVSQESVLKAIDRVNYEGAASRLDIGFGILHFKLFDAQNGVRASNKGRYLA